jgi:hypothetical protein
MAAKQAQALAIKLSRERRAGKQVPAPPKGRYSEGTRRRAQRDLEVGRKRSSARKKAKVTRARTKKKKRSA